MTYIACVEFSAGFILANIFWLIWVWKPKPKNYAAPTSNYQPCPPGNDPVHWGMHLQCIEYAKKMGLGHSSIVGPDYIIQKFKARVIKEYRESQGQ
jgi:hypothetical protein